VMSPVEYVKSYYYKRLIYSVAQLFLVGSRHSLNRLRVVIA
jgi:hypothetical protein